MPNLAGPCPRRGLLKSNPVTSVVWPKVISRQTRADKKRSRWGKNRFLFLTNQHTRDRKKGFLVLGPSFLAFQMFDEPHGRREHDRKYIKSTSTRSPPNAGAALVSQAGARVLEQKHHHDALAGLLERGEMTKMGRGERVKEEHMHWSRGIWGCARGALCHTSVSATTSVLGVLRHR